MLNGRVRKDVLPLDWQDFEDLGLSIMTNEKEKKFKMELLASVGEERINHLN